MIGPAPEGSRRAGGARSTGNDQPCIRLHPTPRFGRSTSSEGQAPREDGQTPATRDRREPRAVFTDICRAPEESSRLAVRNTGLRTRGREILSSFETLLWKLQHDPRTGIYSRDHLVIVCVYRKRNEQRVAVLCQPVIEAGGRVHLWALDEIATGLKPYTRGQGPGSRCELLNLLVEQASLGEEDVIVICDDDIEFVRGDVLRLAAVSKFCGFLLAQPAHSRDSNISYTFTFAVPFVRARATRFVEIGPVVVISPAFRARVFPMPLDSGMGWGLEARWHARLGANESFGIIDDTIVRHLGVVAADYSGADSERARRDKILAEYGMTDLKQLCRSTGRWWIWQRRPVSILVKESKTK
jgi:hypothetical protein